jgi:hypothetical protein
VIGQAVGGAVRGTVATVAMTVPMLLAPDEVMGRRPPKRVTVGILGRLGLDPGDEGERNLASTLAHLGFGASMGALFAVARARLHPPGPAVLHGVAYGVVVYLASYKGWVPALGVLPPPEHDHPARQQVIALAHVVYGAVLGALQ